MSATTAFETILFDIAEGVATVTLNRPDKLNSFTAQMRRDLSDALKRIETDPAVRAMVLTGAGRGFCAGQDLNDRAVKPGDAPPDTGATLDKEYNPLIRRLRALELPVIAAVNGVAAGAGANLALNCDIVIAGKSAKFIQAFCKIGLIPDCGGTWVLPRLIGHQRALGLALLGDTLPAEKALEWGMIWDCVEDDALARTAGDMARHLATQPTRGLAYIKQAFNQSPDNTLNQQLDLERDLQRMAGKTEDFREGVTAFLEKRKPAFKGA